MLLALGRVTSRTCRCSESIHQLTNVLFNFTARSSATLGTGSAVSIISDEVSANARLLTRDEMLMSVSISSSALERCKGEGERAALDLKTEPPPVLLVLAAASIEGHCSDCT